MSGNRALRVPVPRDPLGLQSAATNQVLVGGLCSALAPIVPSVLSCGLISHCGLKPMAALAFVSPRTSPRAGPLSHVVSQNY